ncbi:MAG: sodium-translocating pyrophosphatase [Thermoplasmata archaeon]
MFHIILIALGVAGLTLVFAAFLARAILRQPEGSERMREIARFIQEGASVFLRRELRALSVFTVVLVLVLTFLISPGTIHAELGLAFALGTAASFGSGYLGMWIATRANVRTANLVTGSFTGAMRTAFFGGAVMGSVSVALGLIGLTSLFAAFPAEPEVWLAYAFGASSVALFLRVGGGIFTKSADVGADLVGKVEVGIPEDDPRNPAVIADLVGDNVGDVAGMGSDLYESYVSALAATMVIALAPALNLGVEYALFPLLMGAVGLLASMAGILAVRPRRRAEGYEQEARAARSALNVGVYVSTGVMIVVGYFAAQFLLGQDGLFPFLALVTGLVGGFLIGLSTQYFTSEYGPVRGIARAGESGAAINVMEGLSVGFLSTIPPILVVAGATFVAFFLVEAGSPGSGLYGIAVAAVGMLVTLAMLLSTDAYGPIADNAAGIAEMSGLGSDARERAEALDSVGNTTAAIGKGFAIASAALASLAWIATFLVVAEVTVVPIFAFPLTIREVGVFIGLLTGGLLAFVFSSLTLKAVSSGAFEIVREVRRQFRETPGLREGKVQPDYEAAISLVTRKAIRAMSLPGLLVLVVPLAVGFSLGAEALAGLLLGVLIVGFLLAVTMANSGGAWDNAKKLIESGLHGGKGGEAHKAAVIGDTVGDPFKDTSGPSLNILIKLVGKVAVIFAPLIALIAVV